ncbi:hypothetical protein FISHEDRAFT_34609 [Fistulina hepatica ATCC 64428]|uniref:Dihydrofolate reductase n=1 Tax=Fistulina hepatica ATCC 64428 TaxID=1128425 RepID=A0A0D7AN23_9AGAR|nr:hypothetical protein FISHEDRAFT_34609 [Fistulina hepatica ATCC 64428]
MSRLTIIVAATKNNGIGKNGTLPWRLPKETAYFARATSNSPEGKTNIVIMGRNSWESIPLKFRPLRCRANIVLSRNKNYDLCNNCSPTGDTPTYLYNSLASALNYETRGPSTHRIFIAGGAAVYEESLRLDISKDSSFVDRILLTRILSPAFDDCDIFLPDFLGKDDTHKWTRAAHRTLEEWVGFEVPEGIQTENGVEYEFQMWVRGGASA